MRVLVVDDELGIREGCRRALAPQGFEVEVAENGPSGLHKLQEGVFDILLLDAMMPGMSGLEMLRHVRQLYPDLICIIITGYATVELAVQAMREGAHDFIAKPFTPGLLLEVMNRELDHQRLKREAQRVKNLEEEIRGLTRVKTEMEKLAEVESRFMLTMVHVLRAPVAILQNSVQLIQEGICSAGGTSSSSGKNRSACGRASRHVGRHSYPVPAQGETGYQAYGDRFLGRGLGFCAVVISKRGVRASIDPLDRGCGSPRLARKSGSLSIALEPIVEQCNPVHPQRGTNHTLPQDEILTKGRFRERFPIPGLGLPTEEIPRIFEVFYRTEAAKSIKETGTGLGLPIVQQILSLYGGTIEIDSAPGKGSSIRFILPQSTPQGGGIP